MNKQPPAAPKMATVQINANGPLANCAQVLVDGAQIDGVVSVAFDPIVHGGVISARIELQPSSLNINALPFYGDETLAEINARHGFEGNKIGTLRALREEIAQLQMALKLVEQSQAHGQPRPTTLKGTKL